MKVGNTPTSGDGMALQQETVILRYYFNAEMGPVSLKTALERVKGVSKVEIEPATRTARVTYAGALKGIAAMEPAAANAGVPAAVISHARVVLNLVAQKGADLSKIQSELAGIGGVKCARVAGGAAELYADLQTVTYDSIKDAANRANFDIKLTTHEWVSLKLSSGEGSKVEKEATATKGVLVIRDSSGDQVGMWTVKKVSDDIFKKLAEKAGAVIGEIVRL